MNSHLATHASSLLACYRLMSTTNHHHHHPYFRHHKPLPTQCYKILPVLLDPIVMDTHNTPQVKEYELRRNNFSETGNFGFGIQEHIDLGIKYDPTIGIYGMDYYIVLGRAGFNVPKRRRACAKIGPKHKVCVRVAGGGGGGGGCGEKGRGRFMPLWVFSSAFY